MIPTTLERMFLKNHERMELSWGNNVYDTEFSVETPWETRTPMIAGCSHYEADSGQLEFCLHSTQYKIQKG